MAYATPADLASFLQVPSVDTASAVLFLQLVSDEMDAYVGQALGHQDVVGLLVDGGGAAQLVLPGFPVTAVASIEVLTATGTWRLLAEGADYTWSASGILDRVRSRADPGGPVALAWPSRQQSVRASYSRGEGTVNGSVKGVCLAAAARMFVNPSGLTSEQIGGMSLRYGQKTGAVEFSAWEEKVLGRLSDIVVA
jgi:hypothetical protein